MSGREYRLSIPSTYDSRETGPRYHVTTQVGHRRIKFHEAVQDPFVRTTIYIGWRDLLRGLLKGGLTTTVIVGADRDMVDDVLELDANTLTPGCNTRRDEFNASINEHLRDMREGGA